MTRPIDLRCGSILLVCLAALVLSGCGRLPKPFQRVDAPPDVLTRARVNDGVRVALPQGTTEPMAKLIAQAVVKELTARDIPAVIGLDGKLKFALYGKILPGGGEGSASPTRISWRLAERGNESFFTFNHDVPGSTWEWEWGSPKIIKEIGAKAGSLVAEAVSPTDETLIAVAAPSRGVWVKPIKGAPGDGDTSLTRAMRFALMGAKIAVTSDQAAARHILSGKVLVGKPKGSNQPVEIRWTLTYPDGGVVGHAVQRNQVPSGTFDGRWGEAASLIAAAAVPGVRNVISRAEETVRVRITEDQPRVGSGIIPAGVRPTLPPPELSPEPELPSRRSTN